MATRRFFVFTLIVLALSFGGAVTAQDDTPTVAVVPPALVSPFHVAVQDGAVEQARAFGWEIITQSPERETDFELRSPSSNSSSSRASMPSPSTRSTPTP